MTRPNNAWELIAEAAFTDKRTTPCAGVVADCRCTMHVEDINMEKPLTWFTEFSKWIAEVAGHPITFSLALLTIIVWGVTGPVFGYSDTWQLLINTGTTIVTFLMVFLIQKTQNRDTQAIHLKLDELIRVTKGARNMMLDLEHMDDESLKRLRDIYERLGNQARGEDKEKP
jgi:low affinity Fe/Cu permease